MKPRTILWSWLVLTFIVSGILVLAGCNSQDAELAAQREKELEALRAELEQAKASAAALEPELARLRKDNQELLRLRNEVGMLRDAKQAFAKQAQTAQAAAERAQAQANELAEAEKQRIAQAQASEPAEAEKQRMASLNRQTEYEARIKAAVDASGSLTSPQGQAAAACINNLRQIDGAKQQWALENKKPAEATPTWQDIAPYLVNNVLPPCLAGGAYTLNAVSADPTCSIPGHALPQ